MLPALLEESATTPRASRVRERLGTGLIVALSTVGLAACGGGERQDENEVEGEFPIEIVSADFPASQSLAETSDLVLEIRNSGEETIPDLVVTVFTQAEESVPTLDEADAAASETEDAEVTDTEGEAIPESQLDEEVDQALEAELDEQAAEDTSEDSAAEAEEDDEPRSEAKGPFSVLSQQEGLAIASRPVWILEQGYPREEGTPPNAGPPGEITGGSGTEAAQTNTFSFGSLEPDDSKVLVWRVTTVQPGDYTVRYRVAAGLQGNAVAVNEDGSVPEGEFVVVITNEPPQTRVDEKGEVVPIEPDDVIGQAGRDEQEQEQELNP